MYSNINQVKSEARLVGTKPDQARLSEALGVNLGLGSAPTPTQGVQHKKLFVRNIEEGVSDSLMENLLAVFGEINYWKRSKNEKGVPVSFGSVEFKDIEGVLHCMRLFNGFHLKTKKVEVSMGDTTRQTLADYVTYKREDVERGYPNSSVEEINEKLAKMFSHRDNQMQERLKINVEKYFGNKDRITVIEKGGTEAYTEEKLTSQKKKYGLINTKELDDMFKRDLDNWLRVEREYDEKAEKEFKDEKNKHKNKQQLIEKELEFDEEAEREKIEKSTNYAKFVERRRIKRSKQFEEDMETAGRTSKVVDVDVEALKKRESMESEDRNQHVYERGNSDRRREVSRADKEVHRPTNKFTEVEMDEANNKPTGQMISLKLAHQEANEDRDKTSKPRLFVRDQNELQEEIDEESRLLLDRKGRPNLQIAPDTFRSPADANAEATDDHLIR